MKESIQKEISVVSEKVEQIMTLMYHAVNDLSEVEKIRGIVPAAHALNLCKAAEATALDISDLLYAIEEEAAK